MDAFTSHQNDSSLLRSHPWTSTQSDQANVYMDFKNNPKLIRNSLEDLLPFKKWAFVEEFYSLIEWINSPKSLLESNDCTFNQLENNDDAHYPYAKKCSARLMILFRDIPENCQSRSVDWLMEQLLHCIAGSKQNFRAGAIALSQNETCYLALGDGVNTGGIGHQVVFNFFAYGKNERRCYENMQQVLDHAQSCLKKVNKKILQGELDAIYK